MDDGGDHAAQDRNHSFPNATPSSPRPKKTKTVSWGTQTEITDRGKSRVTEIVLKDAGNPAATSTERTPNHNRSQPSDNTATSLSKNSRSNLVPEYNSESDSDTEENIEKPTQSRPNPSPPPSSMGPPKLSATALRAMQNGHVATETHKGKRFWSVEDLPVERYTRDGRRIWDTGGQGAATETRNGKRTWSVEDLPLERYTRDGRRIWDTGGQGAASETRNGKRTWSVEDLPLERYTMDGRRIR